MVTHLVFAGRGVTVVTVDTVDTVDTVGTGPVMVTAVVVVVVTVLVVVFVVVVEVSEGSLDVAVGAGLARVVWISALRASATFRRSRISSICTCSSSISPGRGGSIITGGSIIVGGVVAVEVGGATVRGVETFVRIAAEEVVDVEADVFGKDRIKLAKDGAGPPFSHTLPKPGFGLSGSGVRGGPSPLLPMAAFASEAARRASRRRVFRVSRWKWTRLKSRASMVASSLGVSLFHLAAAPAAGGAGPGGGCDFSRLQLFSRSARCFFASS